MEPGSRFAQIRASSERLQAPKKFAACRSRCCSSRTPALPRCRSRSRSRSSREPECASPPRFSPSLLLSARRLGSIEKIFMTTSGTAAASLLRGRARYACVRAVCRASLRRVLGVCVCVCVCVFVCCVVLFRRHLFSLLLRVSERQVPYDDTTPSPPAPPHPPPPRARARSRCEPSRRRRARRRPARARRERGRRGRSG